MYHLSVKTYLRLRDCIIISIEIGDDGNYGGSDPEKADSKLLAIDRGIANKFNADKHMYIALHICQMIGGAKV